MLLVIQQALRGYMNVAQKAANRAVSFGEHNRPLLPINLQAQASPMKALRLQIKGMVVDLPVVFITH